MSAKVADLPEQPFFKLKNRLSSLIKFTRMKFLFQIVILLVFSVPIYVGCSSSKTKKSDSKKDTSISEFSKKHQVLLTNYVVLKDENHQSMTGASSFSVHYNNHYYLITARHLLGTAGGFDPEIPAADFNKVLEKWSAYPRVPNSISTDTLVIKESKLNFDLSQADILAFETEKPKTITSLTPSFNLPESGEQLYLLGCPYSEVNCRQNCYTLVFENFDSKMNVLVFSTKESIELAGFSGAPIVDKKGNAVAMLVGQIQAGKQSYIVATGISELKKLLP